MELSFRGIGIRPFYFIVTMIEQKPLIKKNAEKSLTNAMKKKKSFSNG